jgi:uncharacterized protein
MNNTMSKIKYILSFIVLFFGLQFSNFQTFKLSNLYAQDIPEKPSPPKLVNDFAGLLNPQEVNNLEVKLEDFNNTTSTQIVVAIVKSLNGYDPNDFTQKLGEKWGVGQKGKNNGLVIMVCPSERKMSIQTGYGLEAVIPDATCKLIIENEIKPYFRQNNFYKGIDVATNLLMGLAKKEFPASELNKKLQKRESKQNILPAIFIILIVIVIFAVRGFSGAASHYSSKSKFPFWTLFWLSMMSNSGSREGSWNNFSSGSGGFGGGGGGGFGGFGGGSFGGGGASGSW